MRKTRYQVVQWSKLARAIIGCMVAGVLVPQALAAQVVTTSVGTNPAGIQTAVDAFRTALGPLNPNTSGSFGSGRREINWDGVPDALAAPNNLPANFFNVNSPRGVVLSTPGTGFAVSANAGIAPVEFGNINAAYPSLFAPFSGQRLFTALGSNITDVNFFVPGLTTPATSRAFGVVFSDVDVANTTSLQFFDVNNNSLGVFFAPAMAGANETFSFLGVQFATPVVSRVRITSGNQVLGANLNEDAVVMDDFIYAEPITAQVVPEPGTWALSAIGLLSLGLIARRRRHDA